MLVAAEERYKREEDVSREGEMEQRERVMQIQYRGGNEESVCGAFRLKRPEKVWWSISRQMNG